MNQVFLKHSSAERAPNARSAQAALVQLPTWTGRFDGYSPKRATPTCANRVRNRFVALIVAAFALAGCANLGPGYTGGPRDPFSGMHGQ
jgi:hypothetical protein